MMATSYLSRLGHAVAHVGSKVLAVALEEAVAHLLAH